MGKSVGTFVVLFGYVIILYILVRPKSQGPTLLTNAGNAVGSVIKAGTGGGTW